MERIFGFISWSVWFIAAWLVGMNSHLVAWASYFPALIFATIGGMMLIYNIYLSRLRSRRDKFLNELRNRFTRGYR